MENGSFWENFGLLIPLVIIIILSIYLRRRRGGGGSKLEVAAGLLSDVNYNLKIAQAQSTQWGATKKFKVGNWLKHGDKTDFLDEQLQGELATAFELAEDYNQRIAEAKRHKSTSYLAGIPVDQMIDPLTRSKEGLATWIRENYQTEMLQGRRRGLFG